MWKWLLVAGAVLFIMMEREKASVKIAANRGATAGVDAVGRGTVKVIDEAASAVGRWFGGLFRDTPSNTSSSSGGSAAFSDDDDGGYGEAYRDI